MKIADRDISPNHPPFVIAELSGNHNGSIERAFQLIDAAKEAGADAIKLQLYSPESITLDHDGPGFVLHDGPWKGRTLHDLYREARTPQEWFPRLFAHAAERGIVCFSSVFDHAGLELLEYLKCPAYKIASFEIVDIPLIQEVVATGKPVILSTGMASDVEIGNAWSETRLMNAALLHCVSGYPTPAEDYDLGRLKQLRKRYGMHVGLSDHSLGSEVAIAAVALGACIVEKHLTLSRADGGPDAAFSMEPLEFRAMVDGLQRVWRAMQSPMGEPDESSRQLRRSLYVVADIAEGEKFTAENVRSIRPAHGLAPRFLPEIVGKFATCDIKRGTPMAWRMVESLTMPVSVVNWR